MQADAMFFFEGGPLAGEMWSLPFFTKVLTVEQDGEQHIYAFGGSRGDLAEPFTTRTEDGAERVVTVRTQVMTYRGTAPKREKPST